ncbi:Flp family type IVb pilin [Caldimonas thermodepolymerans]|uniref:Flp family type IVb pilin n=1 Tax=Caldimonas thermodepolymerans TaxID=215580 RepID=UPI002235FA64|nr:Flp family type IVb pilin [Caldimonas thermodepolymerans]UZG44201.1 Flp family type IVb pilin [Caldimonas thermodepolymerans]
MNKLKAFWQDESGVSAIEYGLIAGLVAVVLVTVLGGLGGKLKAVFESISNALP